jgi:tetraacyldisaccharide 4'-kinase
MYLWTFVSLRRILMFSNFFLKSFRILLFPFALLYWLGIAMRNWLYNIKIIRSSSFGLPVICVGNLSVGGTGKSPMVEYLVEEFKNRFRLAILSRGYKRKTKGYALANEKSTALDIGDEPMQFHLKFPDVPVAVGEQRIVAIPQLLHDRPMTEAVILDDAFQHRAIRAGLNILLTEYGDLFTHDFYLPTGNLRDQKSSYKRADIIIVTKCKDDLADYERQKTLISIRPLRHQAVFFTAIEYGQPYHIIHKTGINLDNRMEAVLVSGIANPGPLKQFLEGYCCAYTMMQYSDHHIFTIDDLRDIRKKFDSIKEGRKIIFTTEKDAVRLLKFEASLIELPLYVIPIRHHFLFGEGNIFNERIAGFIRDFKRQY